MTSTVYHLYLENRWLRKLKIWQDCDGSILHKCVDVDEHMSSFAVSVHVNGTAISD